MDCQLTYSQNGRHFQRVLRESFLGSDDPGAPGSGCIYPTSVITMLDGSLRIYAGASCEEHGYNSPGKASIIAYELRKNGFVFLKSAGGKGVIGTSPLRCLSDSISSMHSAIAIR